MKQFPLCCGLVLFFSAVGVNMEYFPDISHEEYKKLQEIASYLQKGMEHMQNSEGVPEGFPSKSEIEENKAFPLFDISLLQKNPINFDDSSPLAVGPSDLRYFLGFGTDDNRSQSTKNDQIERAEATSKATDEFNDDSSPYPEVRQVHVTTTYEDKSRGDIYFTAIVAGCSAAAIVSVIVIGISCYRIHRNAKAAASVDYPAYGVTGPNKDISLTSGDRKLAHSAQMYHYQHQKQQIIAMESNKERRLSISDAESEEENEEGDYTVYECPGLAATGEMEVKNPLFQDDQTPAKNNKIEDDLTEESRELPNLISFE